MDTPIKAASSELGRGNRVCAHVFCLVCEDRCTPSYAPDKAKLIECVHSDIGYSRCEHVCARSQAIVFGHQLCSKIRLTTLSLFNNNIKKLLCCIKDAKQMIKKLT